jgi:predicted lactoylglutathione lyase
LAVKDIAACKAFYEKLGFVAIGGEQAGGWLILRNGETKIGLFQRSHYRQ